MASLSHDFLRSWFAKKELKKFVVLDPYNTPQC